MIPIVNYEEILKKLGSDDDYWSRDGRPLKVTMCGLLFARPQTELAAKEVFPELDYFNFRLGSRFHLFTAGCFWGLDGRYPDARWTDSERSWGYSNKAFDGLRREIEAATGWRYKDGVELLLFNATRNRKTRAASLDFHSAIAVDLQLFHRFQASETIATLVGRIARYCDTYQNDDPTWGFSDVMGLQTTRFALRNLLVGCLPEALRSDAHNASLFVTKDLSRK